MITCGGVVSTALAKRSSTAWPRPGRRPARPGWRTRSGCRRRCGCGPPPPPPASKLANERVTPGQAERGVVKPTCAPKTASSTVAAAPLKVLWPETYSGNGGVIEQRRPGRRRPGPGVAGRVGLADGGDRPPGVVGVLGVPGDDGGVGQGDVQLGEQPGVPGQAVALLLGDLLRRSRSSGPAACRCPRRRPRSGRSGSGRRCASVLSARPRRWTSLTASAQAWLVRRAGRRAGTGPGWSWRRAAASAHCGARATSNMGGVGCQRPGRRAGT